MNEAPVGLSESESILDGRTSIIENRDKKAREGKAKKWTLDTQEDEYSEKRGSPIPSYTSGDGALIPTAEITQELLDLEKKLEIEPSQLQDTFILLGIPHHTDRVPRNPKKSIADKDTRCHTASTVTQTLLKNYGWQFLPNDVLAVQRNVKPMSTPDMYKELALESTPGEYLDVFTPPTNNAHLGVQAGLNRKRLRFEDERNTLALPKEWFSDQVKSRRPGFSLNIPSAFQKALDAENKGAKSDTASSSHTQEVESVQGDQLSTPKRRETCLETADDPSATPSMPSASPGFSSDDETFDPAPFTFSANLTKDELIEREQSVRAVIERHKLEVSADNARKLQILLKNEDIRRMDLKTLIDNLGAKIETTQTDNGIKLKARESMENDHLCPWKGNPLINEHAEEPRFSLASILCNWVTFKQPETSIQHKAKMPETSNNGGGKDKQMGGDMPESMVEILVAPLLVGLFWGHPELKETKNEATRFIDPLRLLGTTPEPDYAVRLSGKEWSHWTDRLALVMTSGECKPISKLDEHTVAQLAMNSVATLVILILIYLSTRKSKEDPMPPWMFTMSFTYSQNGFVIYGHFPKPHDEDWNFASWRITDIFQSAWENTTEIKVRMSALATLYELRAHTEFVVKQIRTWSNNLPASVAPIMDRLIAKAHLDIGDYLWLMEKAVKWDVDYTATNKLK